jgi:hypothetical protein
MRTFLRTLRKLVLGETWALPLGVALAVAAAAIVREVAGPGGWWRDGGGWLLFGLLVAALAVSLARTGR